MPMRAMSAPCRCRVTATVTNSFPNIDEEQQDSCRRASLPPVAAQPTATYATDKRRTVRQALDESGPPRRSRTPAYRPRPPIPPCWDAPPTPSSTTSPPDSGGPIRVGMTGSKTPANRARPHRSRSWTGRGSPGIHRRRFACRAFSRTPRCARLPGTAPAACGGSRSCRPTCRSSPARQHRRRQPRPRQPPWYIDCSTTSCAAGCCHRGVPCRRCW
jgi:hypothetical protein